jgi:hypothetical protein
MPAPAVATLAVAAVLVAALAVYLSWIAWTLRQVDAILTEVASGVRTIAQRSEPITPAVTEINGDLEAVASALEGLAGRLDAERPRSQVS